MAELTVHPLPGAVFGARITGLDPRNIGPDDRDLLVAARRARHGLLCFDMGRLLDADELHALTAVFGTPELGPGRVVGYGRAAAPGEDPGSVEEQVARLRAEGQDPYLTHLGNVDPDTLERRRLDARFYGEWEWHTDMSYLDVPPTFSLLHSRRIPEQGGDTWFASQVMAAAALPDHLRRRLQGKQVKHDATYTSSGVLRPGMQPPASPVEAPGAVHPLLRVVPGTREEALFLGRRTNAHVVGLALDESEVLLDELWAHATRPAVCYRHRWEVGQVVVWDNRMLLHRRDPVDPTDVRLMWRTQTVGEAVVPA